MRYLLYRFFSSVSATIIFLFALSFAVAPSASSPIFTTYDFLEYRGNEATQITTRRCEYVDRDSYFLVSPECFLQGWTMPQLSLQEAVDALMPYVANVEDTYQSDAENFRYSSTHLIWNKQLPEWTDMDILYDTDALQLLKKDDIWLQLPKVLLAKDALDDMSVYASVRDTTMYGECRKKNYNIAMHALDGVLLAPGEELNMNELIAYKPGYCKGNGGTYMFYDGVCGSSTQLFWNALINPYLETIQRAPHSQFYISFYGNQGEDAAIYEMYKQFIVKNISDVPLYMRTFTKENDNIVLVSFSPKHEGLKSYVSKQQTGELTAELWNVVINAENTIISQKIRPTVYYGINTTSDL